MNKELTFNDLPMVVAQLRDEVVGMKQMIICCIFWGNTSRGIPEVATPEASERSLLQISNASMTLPV
jgi:hypothetical protein